MENFAFTDSYHSSIGVTSSSFLISLAGISWKITVADFNMTAQYVVSMSLALVLKSERNV